MKIIKGDNAYLHKKGNVAMWDAIDAATEKYIEQILEFSEKKVDRESKDDYEQELLDLVKEITEKVIDALEERFGAEFVYVDCNF